MERPNVITSVTLTYLDGTTMILEGEACTQWSTTYRAAMMLYAQYQQGQPQSPLRRPTMEERPITLRDVMQAVEGDDDEE